MRHLWMGLAASMVMFQLLANSASAHDDESRVVIETEQVEPVQAGAITLEFELIDMKAKKTLSPEDLDITHEKKLHLLIFDPALKEFRHEHPEFVDSKWRVSTHLDVNGSYFVWAQGQVSEDQEEFTSGFRIQIKGGQPTNPLPPVLGENRSGSDDRSKVTLSNSKIRTRRAIGLTLSFTRTDGSKPEITPYLGAMAHVVGVLSDGDTLIHVHPMDHGTPNQLMLHATFPEAGEYRLWVQFIDGGKLRVIPLSVIVNP